MLVFHIALSVFGRRLSTRKLRFLPVLSDILLLLLGCRCPSTMPAPPTLTDVIFKPPEPAVTTIEIEEGLCSSPNSDHFFNSSFAFLQNRVHRKLLHRCFSNMLQSLECDSDACSGRVPGCPGLHHARAPSDGASSSTDSRRCQACSSLAKSLVHIFDEVHSHKRKKERIKSSRKRLENTGSQSSISLWTTDNFADRINLKCNKAKALSVIGATASIASSDLAGAKTKEKPCVGNARSIFQILEDYGYKDNNKLVDGFYKFKPDLKLIPKSEAKVFSCLLRENSLSPEKQESSSEKSQGRVFMLRDGRWESIELETGKLTKTRGTQCCVDQGDETKREEPILRDRAQMQWERRKNTHLWVSKSPGSSSHSKKTKKARLECTEETKKDPIITIWYNKTFRELSLSDELSASGDRNESMSEVSFSHCSGRTTDNGQLSEMADPSDDVDSTRRLVGSPASPFKSSNCSQVCSSCSECNGLVCSMNIIRTDGTPISQSSRSSSIQLDHKKGEPHIPRTSPSPLQVLITPDDRCIVETHETEESPAISAASPGSPVTRVPSRTTINSDEQANYPCKDMPEREVSIRLKSEMKDGNLFRSEPTMNLVGLKNAFNNFLRKRLLTYTNKEKICARPHLDEDLKSKTVPIKLRPAEALRNISVREDNFDKKSVNFWDIFKIRKKHNSVLNDTPDFLEGQSIGDLKSPRMWSKAFHAYNASCTKEMPSEDKDYCHPPDGIHKSLSASSGFFTGTSSVSAAFCSAGLAAERKCENAAAEPSYRQVEDIKRGSVELGHKDNSTNKCLENKANFATDCQKEIFWFGGSSDPDIEPWNLPGPILELEESSTFSSGLSLMSSFSECSLEDEESETSPRQPFKSLRDVPELKDYSQPLEIIP